MRRDPDTGPAGLPGVDGPAPLVGPVGLPTGVPAPDFTLPSAVGPIVSLSALLVDGPVLLVFFPFAFSSVCTVELDEIRDTVDQFDGVQLVAISVDPKFTLRMFAQWRGYPIHLLSDFWPHGAVASAYQVFDERGGMSVRGTFLIDRTGVIRFAEAAEPGAARDQSRWRAAVAELLAAG